MKYFFLLFIFSVFFFADLSSSFHFSSVQAQQGSLGALPNAGLLSGSTESSQAKTDLRDRFLPRATNLLLTFLVGICVLVIIYAGIKYIADGGGESKGQDKDAIIYASLGLIVAIISYAIVQVVLTINWGG